MTLEFKKDDDYLSYFNYCLKCINIIKKYEPVKEYLFLIFDHYYKFQEKEKEVYLGKFREPKYPIKYCKSVLKVFDRIIDENKFDNLNEYVKFISLLDFIPDSVPPLLETAIFKEKADFESYYGNYQFYMNTFAHGSLFLTDFENYNSDLRLVQILKSYYRNFYSRYRYCNPEPNTPEWDRRGFYIEIGQFVVGCAYANDVDLNKMDDFLYDLAINTETLRERLTFNGLLYYDDNDWYTKIRNLDVVLNNYSKQNIAIK